jgi:hypothetical protein
VTEQKPQQEVSPPSIFNFRSPPFWISVLARHSWTHSAKTLLTFRILMSELCITIRILISEYCQHFWTLIS